MESKIILRQGRPLDAHRCALICYETFNNIADKHNFPRYFSSLQEVIDWFIGKFKNQNVYSVIAEIDGQIVGSNFLKIRGEIAGVRPVTVVAPMYLMTFGLYNEPKGTFLPSIFW